MWPGPPVKLKIDLYVDEGISEAQGRDKPASGHEFALPSALSRQKPSRFSFDAGLIELFPVLPDSVRTFSLFPALERVTLAGVIVKWDTEAAGCQNEIDRHVENLP